MAVTGSSTGGRSMVATWHRPGRTDRAVRVLGRRDLDVGDEFGSPVTYDYPTPKRFNGEVHWVEIDVDRDAQDVDHLISPEERLRLAVGLQ
jgi:arylsulfatase